MENKGNFRKALFGFNTKDVMEYIAMLHNEYYAYRKQSEEQIYDLMRKIDELEERACAEDSAETLFDEEQTSLLSDFAENEKKRMDRINEIADRLEDILGKIEALTEKTE